MMSAIFALFVILGTFSAECFFHQYPKRSSYGASADGDPGTPLFLTPFIESGSITEGRRLARVPITESIENIKSYAGFFTVNQTYDSNQYFWYFPAMTKDNTKAPVIVWLQGGPGGSSLYGLFTENGPIQANNGTFEYREYNWALNHHIIFIDNPVGAGFSFTKNDDGYCTDQNQIGEQLYSTITQFFQLFPELQGNPFFITGESYAGKYVPALAYTIHKRNPTATVKINMKGIAIGDGWSDPEHQLVYGKFLNQIGIIDWNEEHALEVYENQTKEYIHQQNWEKAADTWKYMLSTIPINLYNYVNDQGIDDSFVPVLQKSAVRKAIHVGNLEYSVFDAVSQRHLYEDMMKSVAPLISELLDHYDVLTYNGQLDIIVAYPLTVNYLRNLNFTGSEGYATAERHQWLVDGETAGYVKKAGRLTEIMVRNAGHMVPRDQPQWALDMITRFTHNQPFFDSENHI